MRSKHTLAAYRLAEAGRSVCVLERGKEFQPGEYPDTQFEATREMQTDLPAFHTGPRTGLYDLRVNEAKSRVEELAKGLGLDG